METFYGYLFTYSLEFCVPFTDTLPHDYLGASGFERVSRAEGAPVENRLEARAVKKTSTRETKRASRLPHSREKHSPDHFTLRAFSLAMRF